MKNKLLNKANRFNEEVRKEAKQANLEMNSYLSSTFINNIIRSEVNWENFKNNSFSMIVMIKNNTETVINFASNELNQIAKNKEKEVNANLWEKKALLDLLSD